MDYFQILNLHREPFSNSPEPDFFFQSDQHRGCLQKLELAVRLRRGLNVVMGEVGTGKTTLCRRLILNFSSTEKDGIETHLILDPSFSTTQEFLSAVALLLGLPKSADGESEWQLKENIKNYLFRRGIDEGMIVVLIIDEGQKLPDFCLEILREFLNYETNEYKLLQIVIFAQKEFKEVLNSHANFTDRVNQYYFLKPFNFRDTVAMIRFRIAKASSVGTAAPKFFTFPALWAIYISTGGYPRKIITLCHQAMLAMIIQDKVKAGFSLVRSSAGRVSSREVARRPIWALSIAGFVFLLALILMTYWRTGLFTFPHGEAAKKISRPAPAPLAQPLTAATALPVLSEKTASPQEKKLHLTSALINPGDLTSALIDPRETTALKKRPDMLGQLTVKKNDCVLWMLERIYGKDAISQLKSVARANPHIRDMDLVKKGDTINIPARLTESNPLPEGKYWVQVAVTNNLKAAYELLTESPNLPRFFLLPYWNKQDGVIFSVLLRDGFTDEASALSAIKGLPPPFASSARVINGWGEGTAFL